MKRLIGWALFVILIIILRITVFQSTLDLPGGSGQDFKDLIITAVILISLALLIFFYIRAKIREKKERDAAHAAYLKREEEQIRRETPKAILDAVDYLYDEAEKQKTAGNKK